MDPIQLEAMEATITKLGGQLGQAMSQATYWKLKAQEWKNVADALAPDDQESAQDAPDEPETEEGDDDATIAS